MSVYDFGTEEPVLTPLVSTPLEIQYRAVRADAYGRYVLIGAKKAKRNSLAALLQENMEHPANKAAETEFAAEEQTQNEKDVTKTPPRETGWIRIPPKFCLLRARM